MKIDLSDVDLDILLDVLVTHSQRAKQGYEAAADEGALTAITERLAQEWDRRQREPLERPEVVADAIGEGEPHAGSVVDPYDLSHYNNMGDN